MSEFNQNLLKSYDIVILTDFYDLSEIYNIN
jgi:hypothetical protein